MEDYNKDWDDGCKTEVRFCQCGRALIVGSAEDDEWETFQSVWNAAHTGAGHQVVTFQKWLAICLTPRLAKTA